MASRSALLVVDIQRELCGDAATEVPHASRIKAAGTQLLSTARDHISQARGVRAQSKVEVVFVQHNDRTAEEGTLLVDSDPWQLYFQPNEDGQGGGERVLRKTVGDTFESNPDFARYLQSLCVDEVVVFGLQTDCCVQATCKGALRAGFRVTLLQGAHSTYDSASETAEQIERSVEAELTDMGVNVVPWEKWCEALAPGQK